MKFRLTLLFLVAALAVTFVSAAPSAEQQERIAASFVLALGRAPADAEISQWSAQGSQTVSELVARHRQQLQGDAAAQHAVLAQAFQDAYGRSPAAEKFSHSATGTYTELVQQHIKSLASHSDEYAQVLNRVYQLVIRRDVYPEEIEYWKKQDALPFALLVGCVEDWGRRNQPGLMVTAGTPTISINSGYLTTVRLSPAIAAEARAAAGLAPVSEADRTARPGCNIVAPGAEKIVSSGHIHFVAAGGAALVPSGKAD